MARFENGMIGLLAAGVAAAALLGAPKDARAGAHCIFLSGTAREQCFIVKAKIEETTHNVRMNEAFQRALEMHDCMQKAADPKTCWGVYTLLPPRPPQPYQKKIVASIKPADRALLREAMQRDAKLRYEEMLQDIDMLLPGK